MRPVRPGAHYGLRDWIAQRITGIVILAFLLLVLTRLALEGTLSYDAWAGVFAPQAMKVVSLMAFGALCFHAWVGVRDIWMDYIKPTGIRLALIVGTILWLLYCLVWAAQILWSI
jgi:succinate dehydrogenase / fumarate reductase membrane anchor subunit